MLLSTWPVDHLHQNQMHPFEKNKFLFPTQDLLNRTPSEEWSSRIWCFSRLYQVILMHCKIWLSLIYVLNVCTKYIIFILLFHALCYFVKFRTFKNPSLYKILYLKHFSTLHGWIYIISSSNGSGGQHSISSQREDNHLEVSFSLYFCCLQDLTENWVQIQQTSVHWK